MTTKPQLWLFFDKSNICVRQIGLNSDFMKRSLFFPSRYFEFQLFVKPGDFSLFSPSFALSSSPFGFLFGCREREREKKREEESERKRVGDR